MLFKGNPIVPLFLHSSNLIKLWHKKTKVGSLTHQEESGLFLLFLYFGTIRQSGLFRLFSYFDTTRRKWALSSRSLLWHNKTKVGSFVPFPTFSILDDDHLRRHCISRLWQERQKYYLLSLPSFGSV